MDLDQNTSLGSDQLVIDFSYGDGTNGTLRVSTDSNSNGAIFKLSKMPMEQRNGG